MAWSSAALGADELAWRALDKPFIASIAGYGALSTGKIVSGNASGTLGSTDDTDADYPMARLVDGLPGLVSQGSTADTNWTFAMDFGAAGIEFDALAVIRTNIADLAYTQLRLQIADDSTFATNAVTLINVDPSSVYPTAGQRLVDVTLLHTGSDARRYSTTRYVRLTLATGTSGIPYIGALLLLRTYQFEFASLRPYDPDYITSSWYDAETEDGTIYRTVKHTGRKMLDGQFWVRDSAQQTDVLAFLAATNYGQRPFVFCEKPNSDPGSAVLMVMDENSGFPWENAGRRGLRIKAKEQGPSFLSLES